MGRLFASAIVLVVSFVGRGGGAFAAAPGAVTQLAGTLSVKKPDGSIRILSSKSEIQSGDTLNTQKDSYAQIKFADGAQITLKPNITPPASFIQSILGGTAVSAGKSQECVVRR